MSTGTDGATNPNDDNPNDVLISVEDFIENSQAFKGRGRCVCVLFADLVGSTEFKRDRDVIDGLAKTVVHNKVVMTQVVKHGGRVVKYIGDGVLAVFEDAKAAQNALEAGLGILAGIDAENLTLGWGYPQSMSTKIGIHKGDVWYFKYDESGELDPQGATVDLAARLCAKAGSQQLLCTDTTYQAAGGTEKFPNSDGPKQWFIKGINTPVSLRVVAPEGGPCETPPFCGHDRPLRQICQASLEAAHTAIAQGTTEAYREAIRLLREIRVHDPGNFEVNYRLAELLIRLGNGNIPQEALEESLERLWDAKQIRPDAARCWLLASWARYKLWELTDDPDMLTRAVNNAQSAIEKALRFLDVDTRLQGMILLAACLRERFKIDTASNAGDLSVAAQLCEEIRRSFEGTMNRHRSSYLVTHVEVLLDQENTDYELMCQMIEEALRADEHNVKVHEVRARLAKDEGATGDLDLTPTNAPLTPGP